MVELEDQLIDSARGLVAVEYVEAVAVRAMEMRVEPFR